MTPTPQQLKILALIGEGLSTVNGNAVVHVDALIAQGCPVSALATSTCA